MATVPALVEAVNDDCMRITWAHMGANDIGQAVGAMHQYADRSVAVFVGGGAGFGGGGITIQGSPDFQKNGSAAFWETLNSPSETPLIITSSKIRAILEYMESLRPVADGLVVDVTVILNCKRVRT